MTEQFLGQYELSEIVRQYVSALMRSTGELPFDIVRDEGPVEFGEADAKEEYKKAKRRKSRARSKKKDFKPSQDLLDSILVFKLPSEAELALLAEQAKQAMQLARERAGEAVVYCCGAIRIKNEYKCPGNCGERASIKRVNAENR